MGFPLVGMGGLLLLFLTVSDKATIEGTTWGGTLPTPDRRIGSGIGIVGSTFVAAGSLTLLLGASHLTAWAVLLVVVVAALLIYVVMALRLRQHLEAVAKGEPAASKSLSWCLLHPWWRPPR